MTRTSVKAASTLAVIVCASAVACSTGASKSGPSFDYQRGYDSAISGTAASMASAGNSFAKSCKGAIDAVALSIQLGDPVKPIDSQQDFTDGCMAALHAKYPKSDGKDVGS